MKSGCRISETESLPVSEWIGAGILLAAAWLVSAGLIRDHKTDLQELEALYDMIAFIRDNIEHRMKPLPDIFETYTNAWLESCGFLPAVRRTDLRQAWEEQIVSVTGDARSLVEDFVRNIGSGYRTEELRLCEYTLSRLRGILEQTRADTANRLKLYKTVPMMVALSVILILI